MDETSILDMVLMNNSTSQLDSIQASVSYAHDNNKTNPDKQWCEKCNKKAKELQKKYKRNMDMMKQKIQFTDNLIQMYAKCKSNLEESHVKLRTLEEQLKKKDLDNQLIQTQLKSLLDDKNPTEVQDLTSRLAELEQCNSRLEDKVSGMEMTCQMYENKIHAMKEEEMGKIATKKKHNKEVENLEKELKQVKRKLVQSKADNERLQRKYEVAKAGRRNRRNTGSLTTDSEHNHSTTEAKMDDSMTNESETTPFKEPVKRKWSKKMQRKEFVSTEDSEDEQSPKKTGRKFACIKSFPSDDMITSSSNIDTKANENKLKSDASEEQTTHIQADVVSSTSMTDERINEDEVTTPHLPEMPPKVVVTDLMKERILESKAKRAYRSFTRRPTSSQLREMETIAKSPVGQSVIELIAAFCKKHILIGKESFVARKILKLHQDTMNQEIRDAVMTIGHANRVSSQTEESSDDKAKHQERKDNTKPASSIETTLTCNITNVQAAEVDNLNSKVLDQASKMETKVSAEVFPVDPSDLFGNPSEKTELVTDTLFPEPIPYADIKDLNEEKTVEDNGMDIPFEPVTNDDFESFGAEVPIVSGDAEGEVVPGVDFDHVMSLFSSDDETSQTTYSEPVLPISQDKGDVSDHVHAAGIQTSPVATPELVTEVNIPEEKDPISTETLSVVPTTQSPSTQQAFDTVTPVIEPEIRKEKKPLDKVLKIESLSSELPVPTPDIPDVEKCIISLISSDEENLKQSSENQSKPVNLTDQPKSSETEPVRKIRTRSISKSNSESEIICHSTSKVQKKMSKKLRSENRSRGPKKETRKQKSPKTPELSLNKQDKLVTEEKKTLQKRRRSENFPANLPSEPKAKIAKQVLQRDQENTSQSRTLQELTTEDTIKLTTEDTIKLTAAANTKNVKSKGESDKEMGDTISLPFQKSSFKKHPPLIYRESLPFVIGSNSPLPDMESSVDRQFAPVTPDADDFFEDININDVFSNTLEEDLNIESILKDMESSLPVQLSPIPLSSSEDISGADFEDPVTVGMIGDDLSDDESRISISPSANLCTVLNFTPEVAEKSSKKKKLVTKQKKLEITKEEIKISSFNPVVALTRVRLKDTPRRFSCEAPVRARPVPTIKPIVQTQSLEKSVSKQPAISSPKVSFRPDSSFKAFTPLESGPTTKEQPRTSKDIEKSAPKPIQPTKAFTVISQVTIERKKTAERKEILKEKTNDSNKKVPPVDKTSSKANSDGDIGGNSETEASDLRPLGKTISALYARIMKTDVGTRVVFKEVQSFATPAKVREDVPQDMVVSWVAGIVVHAFTFDLLKLIRTQGIPDSDSCMHKVELDFVRVLLSVDKVRRELTGQPSLVKTTVVPTIMRMICKYGHALHSSESMFPPDSPVFGILSPILIKSMLPLPYLHSLTRIMCSLCRMVGSGRDVVDVLRYAFISRSLFEVADLILNVIAMWPKLFSENFPLTGKIVTNSMILRCTLQRQSPYLRSAFLMLQNKLGFKGATHQEEAERNWMECLNLCMTRIKSAALKPDCDDSTVMKLHIQSVDDVYCALQILAVSKDKDFLDMHLIKKNFWPLLNSWSHHLVLNSNAEDGKTVSDACMIGVLRGVTSCLTAMIACQKVKHPSQNVFNLAVIYFGTICKLLLSFTVQYKKTAPITVQCATIATVMALSFCDPDESYTRVHLWLASTQSDVPTKPKAKNDRSHPHLNQLAALYHNCSLRKMAHWMEGRAKNLDPSQHGKTLTQLLWG